jgi:MoaA/NifB/PqqE/SkfB family radical SAM enzyme
MKSSTITHSEAIRVMDELYDNGSRLLIFEGGEPFLWHDGQYRLEHLLRYAKKKFFRTGITTNGLLPLESSADIIWVSIDGLKDIHNQNRGSCFDKIITNIENSEHPKILANITISKTNHTNIPQLIPFISQYVKGITIQFYYPFPGTERLDLSIQERTIILDKLISLKERGLPILNSVETLQALKKNTWKCHSWLISSAEPNGQITNGCYLKNRSEISCDLCGFAAHTEISKAYDWNWEAIMVGRKTFNFRII